jgi:hypothetical protein
MKSSGLPDLSSDTPILYEIRIRGTFDETWRDLIEGMASEVVRDEGQPVTVIRVVVQDQAALAGLLDALLGLNATVLSVTALEPTWEVPT